GDNHGGDWSCRRGDGVYGGYISVSATVLKFIKNAQQSLVAYFLPVKDYNNNYKMLPSRGRA
ncbi:MAG: hypothetical protein LW855_01895, partial [Alphaproteobacteria bacterium]|nr:hypothetical protein [Alphaproteobacteria bacterium]